MYVWLFTQLLLITLHDDGSVLKLNDGSLYNLI